MHDIDAKLSELDALVTRASSIAQAVRQDLLVRTTLAITQNSTMDAVIPQLTSEEQLHESQKRRLAERSREIATLTALVRDLEADLEQSTERSDWLRQVLITMLSYSTGWGVITTREYRRRLRRKLESARLFDGDVYLRNNPDVAAAGIDPLLHYIKHGLLEGRIR